MLACGGLRGVEGPHGLVVGAEVQRLQVRRVGDHLPGAAPSTRPRPCRALCVAALASQSRTFCAPCAKIDIIAKDLAKRTVMASQRGRNSDY